jgi:hypothetical protein
MLCVMAKNVTEPDVYDTMSEISKKIYADVMTREME